MPADKGKAGDLWAKAAELERQFEGYKRRLAERRAAAVVADDRPGVDDGGAEEEEVVVGRGRRYEAYVRRRDEKLRQGWRARMELKEAEMKALWERLDRGRRPDAGAGLLTATPARDQQKPLTFEVKTISPVTSRCSSATKLARPRSSVSSSPAAAASPRLSNRRALHREPPTTPRKENRMPTPSTAAVAAATTPRLKTLSRSRSSLKDKERGCCSVRETPRSPRLQPPRASYDGAGDLKEAPVLEPSADAIAVTRRCLDEQVVLAEIKMAAAVASEPFHLRRSGNGAVRTSSPLVIPRQVDGCTRLDNIDCNIFDISEYSDVEAKKLNIDEGNGDGDHDEIAQSSDKLGNVEITGDSDTEPSYVYIKKDNKEEAVKPSDPLVGSGSDAGPKPDDEKETENFDDTMESSDMIVKESPVIDAEAASRESSGSLYSNVQSSFSHRSELDASATYSPPHSPPSSGSLSTEQLLEADAARLRKKREEEDADTEKSMLTPSTPRSSVSVAVQSPMDAVEGLKRFLTFGKKNSKGKDTEAQATVVVERAPPSVATLVGDDSVSEGWLGGDSIKPRLCSSIAASDDLDNNFVIYPHVRYLQSFVPSPPAKSELKEIAPPTKSPRVHRSFFSLSSFKSRGN